MGIAALVTWVVTALGGFVLLRRWITGGGLRQQRDRATRFPAALVFGHLGLAAVGLLVWIAYVLLDSDRLAWIGFAILVPVAVLGFTLLARWSAGRRHQSAVGVTTTGSTATGEAGPAEQGLPVPVVVAHGLFAVATVVLALLTALAR